MVVLIDYEVVVEINKRVGGAGAGVRSEDGIKSVLARAEPSFGIDHFPTVWLKAATLLEGFGASQHFMDGNKRTAYVASIAMLELNGFRMPSVPAFVSEPAVLAAASRFMEIEKVAAWLEDVHAWRFWRRLRGR